MLLYFGSRSQEVGSLGHTGTLVLFLDISLLFSIETKPDLDFLLLNSQEHRVERN